jgi:hypothetical protein
VKNKKVYLFGLNLLIVGCLVAFFSLSFNDKDSLKTLEVEKLIIKGDGKATIVLEIDKKAPVILIKDENGGTQMSLRGGDHPAISLFHQNKVLAEVKTENDNAEFTIFNGKEKAKIALNSSGIYLKNDNEKIVGSLTTLADGGGGFGLADQKGLAATILRGGDNPSIAMFADKAEPIGAFGVMQNVPHLMVMAENGNEGILLHGGKRSGMMVLDEIGQLKLFICKDGIYQGKQEKQLESNKKPKFFSYSDDQKLLFPNQKDFPIPKEKNIR